MKIKNMFTEIEEVYKLKEEEQKLQKQIREKKENIEKTIEKLINNEARSVYLLSREESIRGMTPKKQIIINGVKNNDIPNIIEKIHTRYNIGEYEVIIYNNYGMIDIEENEKMSDILIRFETNY